MLLQKASLAVVVYHGSYHTPKPFEPFLAALRMQGIEGYCPQLPTSDLSKLNVGDLSHPDYNRDPPPGGYPQPVDDVAIVNDLLVRLIEEEGKNVLLIGHSSGGGAATEAAVPELQARTRQAKNLPGGIVGIFYECGFMIPVGESINSFFQPKGSPPVVPPYCQVHDHGFDGLISTRDGAKYFFNGLDEQTAKYYEATLTASPIFTTILRNDAYTALPCAYLFTEDDLALPLAYQEKMVALQEARAGVDITVYKIPCGHSPHLVYTDELVAKVKEFVQKVTHGFSLTDSALS